MPNTASNDFISLTRPHLSRLRRVGMKMAKDPAEADELVQETLVRAWANWDRFEHSGRVGAWMSRILVNAFISRTRHRKVVDKTASRSDIARHLFDPGRLRAAATPEDCWQEQGLSDEVRAALDGLPEIYREVVILVDLRGYAYKEAAAELGCPVGTVMSRLHRARRQLRASLRDHARAFGLRLAAA